MKKVFLHEMKRGLSALIILLLVFLVLFIIPVCASGVTTEETVDPDTGITAILYTMTYIPVCLILCSVGLVLAATVMPCFFLSYKMRRRSLDLVWSLPVKRTSYLFIRFSAGLLTTVASYTVMYWIGILIAAVRTHGDLYVGYLFLFYLMLLGAGLVVYSLSAYLFTRGNTVRDGVIFVLLFEVIGLFIAASLNTKFSNIISYYFFPFAQIFLAFDLFYYASVDGVMQHVFFYYTQIQTATIIYAFLACAAGATLFLTEKYSRYEKCGQISDSVIGYKTFIPLFVGFGIPCFLNLFNSSLVSCVLSIGITAIIGYILYAVYKRTVKIGWKSFLVFAISILFGTALYLLLNTVLA